MWLSVRGPDGIEDRSGTFGGEFHVQYPQQFKRARDRLATALPGRYRVRWGAVVSLGDTAVPRRLGTTRFRIRRKGSDYSPQHIHMSEPRVSLGLEEGAHETGRGHAGKAR